jgi:hypothetical protein
MRASFWRPMSRRGFEIAGSYPALSRTLSGGPSHRDGSLAGRPDIQASATPGSP